MKKKCQISCRMCKSLHTTVFFHSTLTENTLLENRCAGQKTFPDCVESAFRWEEADGKQTMMSGKYKRKTKQHGRKDRVLGTCGCCSSLGSLVKEHGGQENSKFKAFGAWESALLGRQPEDRGGLGRRTQGRIRGVRGSPWSRCQTRASQAFL